ncbi:MAG TPA: DUF2961 domain-containing protein [bacterium]|nr:DUF2961 domain-containing protein [bacterium]
MKTCYPVLHSLSLGILLGGLVVVLSGCSGQGSEDTSSSHGSSGRGQFALNSPLANLARLQDYQSARASSHDPGGTNTDYLVIKPWGTATFGNLKGPGCITRIWMALNSDAEFYLKRLVLRIYWDDEKTPSIEVPIGDFYGAGFGQYNHYISLAMSIKYYWGLNCYLPMPFEKSARFEVVNESDKQVKALFYQIDYCTFDRLPDRMLRLHAWWNQEMPCFDESYDILNVRGDGQYVGCFLHVRTNERGWWGEGDDRIYIDGDTEPTLYGTGSEDYFGGAWMFNKDYPDAYSGCMFLEGSDTSGRCSMFRFHLEAPVRFLKSFRFEFEHDREDDYCSTAFWYQKEPHEPMPPLPPTLHRLPRGAQMVLPDAHDFEALTLVEGQPEVAREVISVTPGSLPMHQGQRLVLRSKSPFSLSFQLPSLQSGTYRARIYSGRGAQCGVWQCILDGQSVGERFDGYSLREDLGTPNDLGTVKLDSGVHTLEVRVADKNPNSTGYDCYLDCIEFTPTE